MSVTIKNAQVTWSNMLNKLDKKLLSREFCIELPSDSPEIKQLCEEFKMLEEKAKLAYTEQQGKKVKGASQEKGLGAYLFSENDYNPGYTRLKFTIFNINDVEETLEDGSKVKKRVERLNPVYKNLDFCYKINNNGQKEYTIDGSTKHWLPLSENIVDIKCSLVASYNKTDNRVTIRLKADDVCIIKASDFNKGSGSGFITLSTENEEIEQRVEQVKPVETSEQFTAEELSELDI